MTKGAPTNIRLSEEAKRLLELLASARGVSKTAIIEMAIREMSKREGVKQN